MAVVSIFHRISGVLLFIALPYLIFLLHESLASEMSFHQIKSSTSQPWHQIIMWIVLTATGYHFVAGVRHLLLDWHIGESLKGGRAGAYLVIILAVICAALSGVWIWS